MLLPFRTRLVAVVRPVIAFTRICAQHHPQSLAMAKRKRSQLATKDVDTSAPDLDPDMAPHIVDGPTAAQASPDREMSGTHEAVNGVNNSPPDSPLSDAPEDLEPPAKKRQPKGKGKAAAIPKKDDKMEEMLAASAARKTALKGTQTTEPGDPEAEDDEEFYADPEEMKQALSRPPPINSDYLPLPWKGRLGYACLCTYLRNSNPPVFQSRTTRIASILEHRHPLNDPTQPEHAVKNRPDKDQPADVRLGQEFVERLCLANVKDMIKMLRWNHKYNIKFLRLSSEAFPFASHAEYGYKLAPFASEGLAEVGKVVAELGHRVTTHPGQFTQLGSPRDEVVTSSYRDLEYHDEMLSLLKLPEQQDRDAVMILHMGGVFGDKEATLNRFRENYQKLSPSIKKRLVLENDDMSWNVHDLLPICKELNIPFVLDYHHHNIIFDDTKIREGTKDIMDLYPEIRETWTRKGITQKMHYSEPTPPAITGTQRRKHNPRPATLPPCADDMDLMIEAKDKEQAVFELMRTFKLPGFDTFNDVIPHVRRDDNRPVRQPAKKTSKKSKKAAAEEAEEDAEDGEAMPDSGSTTIADDDIGMGGPENRVYWPPGMEDWLRPVKKVVKKKEPSASGAKPKTKEELKAAKEAKQIKEEPAVKTEPDEPNAVENVPKPKKANGKKKEEPVPDIKTEEDVAVPNGKAPAKSARGTKKAGEAPPEVKTEEPELANGGPPPKGSSAPTRKSSGAGAGTKKVKKEPTPTTSDEDAEDMMAEDLDHDSPIKKRGGSSRTSSRAKPARVSYNESDGEDDEE